MADAKDCPACGLVNPPIAIRCDCGWDFTTGRRPTLSPAAADELRAVAAGQRLAILSMIAQLVVGVIGAVAVPTEWLPVMFAPMLLLSVATAVLLFRLAVRLNPGGSGAVLGGLMFVPYLGVGMVLYINAQATRRLQAEGIRVGLLGARQADLNRRIG